MKGRNLGIDMNVLTRKTLKLDRTPLDELWMQPHRHRKRQGAITGPRESVMTIKETNRWKR
jgi:hypothetical protein